MCPISHASQYSSKAIIQYSHGWTQIPKPIIKFHFLKRSYYYHLWRDYWSAKNLTTAYFTQQLPLLVKVSWLRAM